MYSKGVFLNILQYAPQDWRQGLDFATSLNGLGHLELWMEYLPSESEFRELQSMLAGQQLIIHAPFIGVNMSSPWEELAGISFARCHQTMEIAARLDAKVVTLHVGNYPTIEEHSQVTQRLARRLEPLIRDAGPVATVENMPPRGGPYRDALTKLEDLAALKEALPQIKFTLDIGHCLKNYDPIEPFLNQYKDSIYDIHLHDGQLGGADHLRLGTADLDMPKLLAALRDCGYANFLTLETIGPEDTEASWNIWTELEGKQ